MTTIASLIPSYIPPRPTPEEINKGTPLRLESRASVMKRYDIFTKEEQSFNDAGMSVYQIKPIKTFLETEVAWWNANIELTPQQVKTRITSYIEKLETLNKEFQLNLDTAISLLPIEKSKPIVDKITEIENQAKNQGFVDTPSPSDTPSSSVDLSGAVSSVDVTKLQGTLDTKAAKEKSVKDAEIQKKISRTFNDDLHSAIKHVASIFLTLLYICIALRFAGFASSELLYKPLPYRIIAFIYTFIFAFFLFPYYVYREIIDFFWPSSDYVPRYESIFPVNPYEEGTELTINKRLSGYLNSKDHIAWVSKMIQEQTQQREKTLHSSVLQSLIAAKEISLRK